MINLTIFFFVFMSILYMFRATSCSSSGESIVSIQHLLYQMYRYNWVSWWWARGCSKHVENWRKYIEKNCASSWSFTKNIFRCSLHASYSRLQCVDYRSFILLKWLHMCKSHVRLITDEEEITLLYSWQSLCYRQDDGQVFTRVAVVLWRLSFCLLHLVKCV